MSDIPMVEVIVRVKQSYYYRNNLLGNVLFSEVYMYSS
mgnify:FL=1